jgi:hypothetical protein
VLHPTDWESVELALSSTNAVEHLSLPYDPATRPVVATVSEIAGVGHVLAQDAVVVDVDTIGIGVQWSESSNSTAAAVTCPSRTDRPTTHTACSPGPACIRCAWTWS